MAAAVRLFPKPLPRQLAELRKLFRRWVRFITQIRETPRRERLEFLKKSSLEYAILHDRLLAECAAHGEHATAAQREFFDHLTSLIAPWATLESLSQQPVNILVDLIGQATEGERTLHCPRRAPRWIQRVALSILAGAFTVLVFPHVWLALFPSSGSLVGHSVDFTRSVTLFVERMTDKERSIVLTAVILTAGITALHSSRQY